MDNSSINSIFHSYLIELYLNPRVKGLDNSFILSLFKLLNELDENKRNKLWNCFIESILNTPILKNLSN